MKDIPNISIGAYAEQHALDYLQERGLRLLNRNYRCSHGEIDLIMRDNDYIVFVEVRTRSHPDYASAVESVDKSKQNKLIKTAVYYLLENNWYNKVDCRFDIIGIDTFNTPAILDWIPNAFSTDKY